MAPSVSLKATLGHSQTLTRSQTMAAREDSWNSVHVQSPSQALLVLSAEC